MTWTFDTESKEIASLLTESGDFLLTEAGEYLETESNLYINDTSTSLYAWNDTETTWDDPLILWGGNVPYTFDSELIATYTNDTI